MKVKELYKKIKKTPFQLLVRKGTRRIKRGSYGFILKNHDKRWASGKEYLNLRMNILPIQIKKLDLSKLSLETVQQFWTKYHAHEFDLLGSEWQNCGYKDNAPGFEGAKYSSTQLITDTEGEFLKNILPKACWKKSKKYWKEIKQPYEGINWQKDFKSGYEWKLTDWYYPLKLAAHPGGDIKIPWELGRLQHLPRLAICYFFLEDEREEIQKEFQNQLLDFFAQNPIRWGCQSMCCMDMGIRVANIILAFSLFSIQGAKFDLKFETIIAGELYNICSHIFHNLEWSDEFTNNHYLANLTGLLFGAIGVNGGKENKQWMQFAGEEVEKEFDKQFYQEGTNKEGSTAYHRLSSELILYSLALGKRYDVIKKIDYNRLAGSLDFLETITRPDRHITSIGDNDSGLLFRLSFTGKGLEEQLNEAGPTISALKSFFKGEVKNQENNYPLEFSLVRELLGDMNYPLFYQAQTPIILDRIEYKQLPYRHQWYVNAKEKDLTKNIVTKVYYEFGLYIWKSPALYLCISMADIGQGGNGGHAHNDKLSFELFIEGKSFFEDPGTYVYTASESLRNQYRSTLAHNTIWVGQEQNEFVTPFSMKNEAICRVAKFNDTEFLGEVRYKSIIHVRKIRIKKNAIEITDFCNKQFTNHKCCTVVCDGYGVKRRERNATENI